MKRIIPFALLVCIYATMLASAQTATDSSAIGPAPGSYRITAPDSLIEIPFSIFRGDILLQGGQVNGRPVRMMIDNGYLWDELMFFGSPAIDSLQLTYDGEGVITGTPDDDAMKTSLASGITISFPGVEFYDQRAVVTPYTAGLANMWEETDGQVSGTFLKHFVVSVDFDRGIMTLTPPDKFDSSGHGSELPMISLGNGAWAIPATLEGMDGRKFALDLHMDLGLNDALWAVTDGPHQIGLPQNVIESSLGFGAVGEVRGHFGRFRSVRLGDYTVDSVIAGFMNGKQVEGTNGEVTIGLDLISRFNIIFDYPHQKVYIEPNRSFDRSFEYDMSGVTLRRVKGNDNWRIAMTVVPGSPAEIAGLKAGDTVTTINGKPAGGYDIFALHPIMRQPNADVSFVVLRNGQEIPMLIKLRRII